MNCPDCEYNKARAANWRSEAYRLGGHDYLPRLWVGLTTEEIEKCKDEADYWGDVDVDEFAKVIEAKLKEKNA